MAKNKKSKIKKEKDLNAIAEPGNALMDIEKLKQLFMSNLGMGLGTNDNTPFNPEDYNCMEEDLKYSIEKINEYDNLVLKMESDIDSAINGDFTCIQNLKDDNKFDPKTHTLEYYKDIKDKEFKNNLTIVKNYVTNYNNIKEEFEKYTKEINSCIPEFNDDSVFRLVEESMDMNSEYYLNLLYQNYLKL